MTACIVDSEACPVLSRQLKQLEKKYRQIRSDLDECIAAVQKDYRSACDAARIPRLKLPYETWKYSFGSTDLRKSPRHSFRVIGVFLEEEETDKLRTMHLILCYFKGDQEDVTGEQIKRAVEAMAASASE